MKFFLKLTELWCYKVQLRWFPIVFFRCVQILKIWMTSCRTPCASSLHSGLCHISGYILAVWDLGSLLISSSSGASKLFFSAPGYRQCRQAGCRHTVRGCCCFVLLLSSAREYSLSLPLLVTYGWDSTRDPSWAGDTAAGAWHLASCKGGLWEYRLRVWGVYRETGVL